MANRIRDVHVVNHRLDPHETELRIHVELDELTPTTQIKGRLMGPRNVYASTVEVAYPMREVERGPAIVMRVVIPEPSWWEPKTPFLYEGPLELWQDGQLCARETLSHGVSNFRIGPGGLTLNGRPFVMRGKEVAPTISEAELKFLHEKEFNLVKVTFRNEIEWLNSQLFRLANRCGLCVLCCAPDEFDLVQFKLFAPLFVSALACVVQWEITEEDRVRGFLAAQRGRKKLLFGVQWPLASITEGAAFVLCREADIDNVGQGTIRKIVLTEKLLDPSPPRPDVIGWIESP